MEKWQKKIFEEIITEHLQIVKNYEPRDPRNLNTQQKKYIESHTKEHCHILLKRHTTNKKKIFANNLLIKHLYREWKITIKIQ